MSDEVKTRSGSPESFGWQRRPDLDGSFKGGIGLAYERPDGALYLFSPRKKPEIVRLIDAQDSRRGG